MTILSRMYKDQQSPLLIAIVGADGSGKSSVGQVLLEWMQSQQPTRLCHLGKQTGNWGRTIARFPVYGHMIDKNIVERASKVRTEKGAGLFTSIVIFMLSMRRVFRFLKMLRLHAQGYAILTDRYPQAHVPGPMDGPGLVARNPNGLVARKLTILEQRLYDWMSSYKPDLVIRLNVDLDTALRRKPDHRPGSLKRKIEDVSKLRFDGSPILDLMATNSFDDVVAEARDAIQVILVSKGFKNFERRS